MVLNHLIHARGRRACPGDPENKALRHNNRGGRDKPGHDSAGKCFNMRNLL
jgi:hypothetical protein